MSKQASRRQTTRPTVLFKNKEENRFIAVDFTPGETFRDVEERILEERGVPMKDQLLIQENEMRVCISYMGDRIDQRDTRKFNFKLPSTATIERVKNLLLPEVDLPIKRMRLTFNRKEVDGMQTIGEVCERPEDDIFQKVGVWKPTTLGLLLEVRIVDGMNLEVKRRMTLR